VILVGRSKGRSNQCQRRDRYVESYLFVDILEGSLSECPYALDGRGVSLAHDFKQHHYLRSVQHTIRAN